VYPQRDAAWSSDAVQGVEAGAVALKAWCQLPRHPVIVRAVLALPAYPQAACPPTAVIVM
jgi:hypothetical protein